jgi:hypothetical protein
MKNILKRADGLPQMVECLPRNCKALSSNPSAKKKKYTEELPQLSYRLPPQEALLLEAL